MSSRQQRYLIKDLLIWVQCLNLMTLNLGKYFILSDDEIKDAKESIRYSMLELKNKGFLPEEYDDHLLTDKPWIGFSEYHVLDDVLVVYYRIEKIILLDSLLL